MRGQMTMQQRDLIRDTVGQMQPQVVVDIGTWYGGGSTMAAARAMEKYEVRNAPRVLHTYEIDKDRYVSAVLAYQNECPQLFKYVRFHLGDFLAEPKPDHIDLAIIDGPEDADFTIQALAECDLRGADTVILHDWNAHKCEAIRANLDDLNWRLDKLLPENVGMARLRRTEG